MALVGFALAASMFFVIQSVLFTFPTVWLSGAAAAAGIAFVNCLGLLGGFLGPTIMGALETSTGSARAGLWFIVAMCAISIVTPWALRGATKADR